MLVKKQIIIGGSIVLVLTVGLALWSAGNNSKKEAPMPTPVPKTTLPSLPIDPLSNQSPNTRFVFTFIPPQVPTELPVYQPSSSSSLSLAKSMAAGFGFAGNPTVDTEVVSKFYSWNATDGSSFTYQETPPSLSYATRADPSGPVPSIGEADKVLLAFAQKHALLGSNTSLVRVGGAYLLSNGQNLIAARGPQNANVVSLSYKYTIGIYPLYTEPKSDADVSALLTKNGAIRSLSMAVRPTLIKGPSMQLVSVDQAAFALQAGKGVLVHAVSNKDTETTPDVIVTDATITDARLVYFLDHKKNLVRPVYSFSGTGKGASGPSMTITYFVSAMTE